MLHLVRHGRTDANATGLLLGHLDPPLDPEGARQARAVADALADESPSCRRVITSPLARTRQTAALIAERMGAELEIDERWIELDYGTLDGVPLRDVPAEIWRQWRADPSFIPGGGESLVALGRRVNDALVELAPDFGTADIVVVSHVSPIKAAVAWALGVGDEVAWRMFLAPASITRIAQRNTEPSLISFNDTSPLG